MRSPDEDQWKLIRAHVSTEDSFTAPTGVVLTAASLVRGSSEIQSQASVRMDDESTTWTFDLAIGSSALAHGVVHYDKSHHDQSDEVQPFGPAPTLTVKESWVRPLSTVCKVDVGGLLRVNTTNDWFATGAVTLTFEDGTAVQIPSQDSLYSEDARQRSDQFHSAIRDAIGF